MVSQHKLVSGQGLGSTEMETSAALWSHVAEEGH